jgi:hypothetical protein
MSVYIQLFHGRHTTIEELDDWGFDGPVLGPFPWFHMTYGDDVKLGDPIVVDGKEIEFPVPDNDSFIRFLGAFYGDMSIVDRATVRRSPELLKRCRDTSKAFKIPMKDLPKHVNDPEEWIKHYAILKMKGEL